MKIINACWDEAITGLKTCEVIFERGDNFQTYIGSEVEAMYDFSITKIPIGDLQLVHQMEECGYRYLENQLNLSFEVDQTEKIEQKWRKLLSGFTYYQVTEKLQIDSLVAEVEDGMFDADRVTLDPYWDKNISSVRYKNWIIEMFKTNIADFYIMKRGNDNTGFFSIKHISKTVCSCPIAGIFNNYKSFGFFFPLTWFWLLESKKKGYRTLQSSISTNNKAIHRFLSKIFFYRIDKTLIVLRKVIR